MSDPIEGGRTRGTIVPRRKKVEEGTPPLPATKPEEMPEDLWNLGRRLGNVVLAGNLIELSNGVREPVSISETVAVLGAARKIESIALARYTKLAQNSALHVAEAEYKTAAARTASLSLLLTDPSAIMRVHLNGATNGTGENGVNEPK